MKKISLPLVFVAFVAFAACSGDSDFHRSQILWPQGNPYWADQPGDTLHYVTTENHTLQIVGDWLTIPETFRRHSDLKANSEYYLWAPVSFTPNTSHHTRYAQVTVSTVDASYATATNFVQLAILEVTRPSTFVTAYESYIRYRLVMPSASVRDSIAFSVNGDWTLRPLQGTWLHPEQLEGKAGARTVYLNTEQNITGTERFDTLLLTSCGVEDTIFVSQVAPVVK